jgi:hypothetical protein
MKKLILNLMASLIIIALFSSHSSAPRESDDSSIGVALAAPSLTAAGPLLQEAGIAAWTDLGSPISLSAAQSAFKTVEETGKDYTVGILDPSWAYGPHIYVSSQGLVIAYYRRGEPTSKIINVAKSVSPLEETMLQQYLRRFGDQIGKPIRSLNYYHFGYPEATRLLLVADSNRFEFQIPSQVRLYELSWALYTCGNQSPSVSLSGKELAADAVPFASVVVDYGVSCLVYSDVISGAEVAADKSYRVEVTSGERVGFAFLYR